MQFSSTPTMIPADMAAVEESSCRPYIMAQWVGGEEATSLLKKQVPVVAKHSGSSKDTAQWAGSHDLKVTINTKQANPETLGEQH